MIWKNTETRYGNAAKSFHWIIALLIIGLLAMGLIMTDLPMSPQKFKIYGLHKSIGITVLTLALLRLGWRLVNIVPAPFPGHRPWERILAKLTHVFLYAAMFGMPLTGWLMSSASNFPVSVFGLFTLPNLTAPDKDFSHVMRECHETLAWALMAALALHIVGALKHHIMDRDGTLKRMLPGDRP